MNADACSTRSLNRNPDLFIAGAGPAGLACAIAAASQGLSVEVADAMQPPIDKACGEGLMPYSLAALAVLGVDPSHAVSAPLHGIRFLGASASTQAEFPDGHGRGIRRNLLHQLLLDRAASLGVRFRWQTVVRRLDAGTVCTNRHSIRPRWIVGADGHQSRIRSAANLDHGITTSRRVGLQQHFTLDLWTNHVEIYWSDHGQAYVTPVSPNEVSVVFLARTRLSGLDSTLQAYPALQRRLQTAVPCGPSRGAVTTSRRLRRVTSENVALIGDASGSVDAMTGEGLALCFRQAVAFAGALKAGDLSRYECDHRAICRLPGLMSRTMLLLDRYKFLRENVLGAFSRRPALFRGLLGVHTGEQPLRLLGPQGMLATGLHILANPLVS